MAGNAFGPVNAPEMPGSPAKHGNPERNPSMTFLTAPPVGVTGGPNYWSSVSPGEFLPIIEVGEHYDKSGRMDDYARKQFGARNVIYWERYNAEPARELCNSEQAYRKWFGINVWEPFCGILARHEYVDMSAKELADATRDCGWNVLDKISLRGVIRRLDEEDIPWASELCYRKYDGASRFGRPGLEWAVVSYALHPPSSFLIDDGIELMLRLKKNGCVADFHGGNKQL